MNAPRRRGRPPGSGVPDGHTRMSGGYAYIKHGGQWRLHHHVVWEAAHGAVPDGHVVAFRDGDRTHVALSNLELVAKADWLRRYDVGLLPPALAELFHLKGQLQREIANVESPQQRRWTADEDAVLVALYANTPGADIAAKLGRSVGAVWRRASALKLAKNQDSNPQAKKETHEREQ